MSVPSLHLPLQSLNVDDFGAESLQDDADVLDGEVGLLVGAQLVNLEAEEMRSMANIGREIKNI